MDRYEIIRAIQGYCANIHAAKTDWTELDGRHIAHLLNKDDDPWGLFRFMDEKTGHFTVGYQTKDGREWFHILRQMRNTPGSGLFEGLREKGEYIA